MIFLKVIQKPFCKNINIEETFISLKDQSINLLDLSKRLFDNLSDDG